MQSHAQKNQPIIFAYRETNNYYKALLEDNLMVCGDVTLAWLISETQAPGMLAIHSLQYKQIKAEHKFINDTLFLYHTESGWTCDKTGHINTEKMTTDLSSLFQLLTNDLHVSFPSEARIYPQEKEAANAYANYGITRSIKNKYTPLMALAVAPIPEMILMDSFVTQMKEKTICPVTKKKMQDPILIKQDINIYIQCMFKKSRLLVLKKGHSYDKSILKKFKGIDIQYEDNTLLKEMIEHAKNKGRLKKILQGYSEKPNPENVILQLLLDIVNQNVCTKKNY